jgi:hypothetical protein
VKVFFESNPLLVRERILRRNDDAVLDLALIHYLQTIRGRKKAFPSIE